MKELLLVGKILWRFDIVFQKSLIHLFYHQIFLKWLIQNDQNSVWENVRCNIFVLIPELCISGKQSLNGHFNKPSINRGSSYHTGLSSKIFLFTQPIEVLWFPWPTLRKICQNTGFFRTIFSLIRTEY